MTGSSRMALLAAAFTCIAPAAAVAQGGTVKRDSTRQQQLDAVVVTADRTPASIAVATASVTRLDASTFRRLPARTVSDALRYVPGITFIDFDGLGHDPQVMLRGFYGGGEAEYVVMLIDGRPTSALETGRVTWDLMPLTEVAAIEIVRGGASAAWGDAAVGGVINIITRAAGVQRLSGSVDAGSFDSFRGSLGGSLMLGHMPLSVYGTGFRTEGFREHAERRTGGVGATFGIVNDGNNNVSLSLINDWRSYEEPGALEASELEASRMQSSALFRFDEVDEKLNRLGIDARTSLGAGSRLSAAVHAEMRDQDRLRTISPFPGFGETKVRDLDTRRVYLSVQLDVPARLVASDNFSLGIEGAHGTLRSSYFPFFAGSAEEYEQASPGRGARDAFAKGSRSSASAFALYGMDLTRSLRLTAQGRFDWVSDRIDESDAAGFAPTATHVAFSPRFGINWRYGKGGSAGTLYATVGRSFKTPTVDQLFDLRSIGIPGSDPPVGIVISNPALEPQRGISYEAGAYHSVPIGGPVSGLDISLSVYHMDMKNEIDFDAQAFSYGNIARSRHRGVETGLALNGPSGSRLFANYTLQDATSRVAGNEGNQLKAIPRHVFVGSASVAPGRLALGANVTTAQRIYLDDGNQLRIPNWTRVDARAAWRFGPASLFVDVINALDREYSTTGFPVFTGPSDPPAVYLYPAAGRAVKVGLLRDW